MQRKHIISIISFWIITLSLVIIYWWYSRIHQVDLDRKEFVSVQKIQQGSLVSLDISVLNQSGALISSEESKKILIWSNYLPDSVERALLGSQVGDKLEIVFTGTLQWSGRIIQAIKNEQILPEYDMDVPAKNYFGSVFLDRTWVEYPWVRPGDEIQVDSYGTGVIIDIIGWVIQIEVPNIYSPFYGQKLQIGASWDQWDRRLTVKEIQGDIMTLHVENTDSPFLWKQIEPWLEWMQDGKMMRIEQMFNDYVLASFDDAKETKKYRIVVKSIE